MDGRRNVLNTTSLSDSELHCGSMYQHLFQINELIQPNILMQILQLAGYNNTAVTIL